MEFEALKQVQSVEDTILPIFGQDEEGRFVTQTDKDTWYVRRNFFKSDPLPIFYQKTIKNHDTILCMTDKEQVDTNITLGFAEQAIRRGDSLVIFDPSGELFKRYTMDVLSDAGYEIRILDFENPEKSNIGIPLCDYIEMSVENAMGTLPIEEGDLCMLFYTAIASTERLSFYAEVLTYNFTSLFVIGADELDKKEIWPLAKGILQFQLYLKVKRESADSKEEKREVKLLENLLQHHAGVERVPLIRGANTIVQDMPEDISEIFQNIKNINTKYSRQIVSAANYVAESVMDLLFGENSIFNRNIFAREKPDGIDCLDTFDDTFDPFDLSHGKKTAIIIQAAPEKMIDKRGQIFVPLIFNLLRSIVEMAEFKHNNQLLFQIKDEGKEYRETENYIYTNGKDVFVEPHYESPIYDSVCSFCCIASNNGGNRYTGQDSICSVCEKMSMAHIEQNKGARNSRVFFNRFIPRVSVIATELPYALIYDYEWLAYNPYQDFGFLNAIKTITSVYTEHCASASIRLQDKAWFNKPCARMSFFIGVPEASKKIEALSQPYKLNKGTYRNIRRDISYQLEDNLTAMMISGIKEENIPLWKGFLENTRLQNITAAPLNEACYPWRVIIIPGLSMNERAQYGVGLRYSDDSHFNPNYDDVPRYNITPLVLHIAAIDLYPSVEKLIRELHKQPRWSRVPHPPLLNQGAST